MAEALTFKSWLIQPGHHRELQSISSQLRSILREKVVIASWPDLYKCFEKSVELSDTHRNIFEPVFKDCPPSKETGATDKQIRIYRGATPTEIETPDLNEEITVTYRGQKIEKKRSHVEEVVEQTGSSKPRFYRGAKIG